MASIKMHFLLLKSLKKHNSGRKWAVNSLFKNKVGESVAMIINDKSNNFLYSPRNAIFLHKISFVKCLVIINYNVLTYSHLYNF